ncbi:hypothetical protein [Streptomyces sp. 1222.5]|uniref:hypothetical protein n=1 Tax=Streptomyces sp. 1222.5 TaxID=1881026 RepID=UPI003EBCFF0E
MSAALIHLANELVRDSERKYPLTDDVNRVAIDSRGIPVHRLPQVGPALLAA